MVYYNSLNIGVDLTDIFQALDIAQGLPYMHSVKIRSSSPGMVHSSLNMFNVLVKDSERVAISGFGHEKFNTYSTNVTFQVLTVKWKGDERVPRFWGVYKLKLGRQYGVSIYG
jgi:hypothetical protein